MKKSMYALILAGGGGTRLWPLSRTDFPKQFLHLGKNRSLLQTTVNRFLQPPQWDAVAIAINAQYEPLARQQLNALEENLHFIVEPLRKNTAPAIAYSIKYLQEALQAKDDAFVLVLPSDHLIEPQSVFIHYVEKLKSFVQQDHLVLFGVPPTKPETGYGYIQIEKPSDFLTYKVKRFVEKPNHAIAESFLASGDYYWNMGMFAFTIRHFWRLLETHAPQIHALMQGSLEDVASRFASMPDISFDYAILEKCAETFVCPLPVSWSDIGCWDSVYDALEKDENQNVKQGNVLEIDTKNSLIFGGKRLISTIGLEDLIIVESEDATFIGKKGESQKVRQIVQELLKRKPAEKIHQEFSWGTLSTLDKTPAYSLFKVTLFPHQSWEPTTQNGTLLSLAESGEFSLNGTILPFPFLHLHSFTEMELKVLNRTEESLHFLLIEKLPLNREIH